MADRPSREETTASLASVLDAIHDGVLVFDIDRRVICYNRSFLTMFGFAAEEIEAGGVDRLIGRLSGHVDDVHARGASLEAALSSNCESRVREIIRFRDGRVFECFVTPHTIDGRTIGRVASFREIPPTITPEETFEQQTFLEKAQELAHIGSWMAELDGSDRLEWSTEVLRIFGLGGAEFDGTSKSFLARVHEDDREAVATAGTTAIAGDAPYDIEHRIVRPDGSTRWVHQKADIVRDAQGTALRMIGTIQDITERRQLEDQLRQSQKMEAIGRLAGGIAHDLNNALTAIAGYAELALGEIGVNESARADVEEIRRAAERAGSVTRQLLAFSRKQVIEPRVFDLNDTIMAVERLLARLLGADIQVRMELGSKMPHVLGDPGQIEQAVINLALNARDAMPQGGRLTLATAVEDVAEPLLRQNVPMKPGRYVVLRVIDTGHGMSAETQARIFEPFFTTKQVGKGTGLGLSMVYGTLKQIGGFIFVDSVVDRGTTFHLYFPPAPSMLEERDLSGADARLKRDQETVLIVEDEAAVRNLVASALRTDGYRLLLAGTAEEALALAERHGDKIDLLLTDAIMPGKSGIELANALTSSRPRLQVILMSGYTEEALGGLDRRRVQLLQKPFTPRDLRRRIGEALGHSAPT